MFKFVNLTCTFRLDSYPKSKHLIYILDQATSPRLRTLIDHSDLQVQHNCRHLRFNAHQWPLPSY